MQIHSLFIMGNNLQTSQVYLSLGSNMGDRIDYMDSAKEKLNSSPDISITKESRIFETEPWPAEKNGKEHPDREEGEKWFLNQVVQIDTLLNPQELLKHIQIIENNLGRTKKHHWGPREIDIDILLYNTEIIDLPNLQIPHRHMIDRKFILMPLVDLNSELKDPRTSQSYKTILENIKDNHRVIPFL